MNTIDWKPKQNPFNVFSVYPKIFLGDYKCGTKEVWNVIVSAIVDDKML